MATTDDRDVPMTPVAWIGIVLVGAAALVLPMFVLDDGGSGQPPAVGLTLSMGGGALVGALGGVLVGWRRTSWLAGLVGGALAGAGGAALVWWFVTAGPGVGGNWRRARHVVAMLGQVPGAIVYLVLARRRRAAARA